MILTLLLAACRDTGTIPAAERTAIADSLRALVTHAYDFSLPNVPERLIALYPDSGRVISAVAGNVTTSLPPLQREIRSFWQRVGQNMQQPTFELGSSYVDVLTRDAAVMTFTYRIPHRTPAGAPHTVGGAWTTLWRRQHGRWAIVQEHLSDAPDTSGVSMDVPASMPSRPSGATDRDDTSASPPSAHRPDKTTHP